MSHLLSRSREYYRDSATHVKAVTVRMKKFDEAAEETQLEHKRRAVDLELKTVEKRVLSELGNAHLKQAIHITATGAKAAASNTEYKEPGGKSMIMIFDDGTVRADYGFMPVGPLILTRAEFEKLITTLLDRASTEPLIRELPAVEIVRDYFKEEFMKDRR